MARSEGIDRNRSSFRRVESSKYNKRARGGPGPSVRIFRWQAAMSRISKLEVNGKSYPIDADSETSLLSVLRDQLDLTGSKYGCGEGQCGACTVLIDGNPRRSCITPVGAVAPKQITTIEGLAVNGRLHPLQEAFIEEGAMQCAYCTSGMIMSGVALLRSKPHPSDTEIAQFMQGNICRCGVYPRIVAAVRRAAKAPKEAR
jgi:aerobic-type carbon monoxide dehydrogenase small subunit (CoxS/CutS family)